MFLFDLAGALKPNNDLEGTHATVAFRVFLQNTPMGSWGGALSSDPHSFSLSAYVCYVFREQNSNNCPSHRQARISLTITCELDQVEFMGHGTGLCHSGFFFLLLAIFIRISEMIFK